MENFDFGNCQVLGIDGLNPRFRVVLTCVDDE